MLESKTIPTDIFGVLTIKCVLIEYDYPRAFIAESSDSGLYALVEHSSEKASFGWNVSKVSLKNINDVNNGEKSFQSLFLGNELFYLDFARDKGICVAKKVDGFYGDYEIKGNLFLKDFCDMDELFDYHGLLRTAKITKKRSLSYIIEGSIKPLTGQILRVIKYLSEICKNLDKPIDILNSDLLVQGNSTVLTFSFDDSKEDTVFQDTDNIDENEEGLNALGNLLSTDDPASLIVESGKKNNKVLQKLASFINVCEDEKMNNPRIIISKPDSVKIQSLRYGKHYSQQKKKAINEARKIVKNSFTKDVEIKNVKGVLTGVVTNKGNTFYLEDLKTKTTYTGLIDFQLINSEESFEVKGVVYDAKLEHTRILNNGEVIKETNKLLELKKVGNIAQFEQLKMI